MYRGFSLIELITVLAIVALLSAISYPSYRHYVIRAHRSEGQTALYDLATRMERYFAEHHTYQSATIGQNNSTDILSTPQSQQQWYALSITKAHDSSYTLQATPLGTQINDALCQSLTLNHIGHKDITTGPGGLPTGTPAQCW